MVVRERGGGGRGGVWVVPCVGACTNLSNWEPSFERVLLAIPGHTEHITVEAIASHKHGCHYVRMPTNLMYFNFNRYYLANLASGAKIN